MVSRSPHVWLCLSVAFGILTFRLSAWGIFGNAFAGSAADAFTCSRLVQLATIALIVIVTATKPFSKKAWRWAILLAIASMLAGCVGALSMVSADGSLFIVGRMVNGFGSAIMLLGWGTCTVLIGPKLAALSVTGAFALYGIVTTVLSDVSGLTLGIIATVSPVLSGALLLYLQGRLQPSDIKRTGLNLRRWACPPEGILFLLALCSLICMVAEITISPFQEASRVFRANDLRLPVFLAVFAFTVVWVFVLRRDNPDQVWGFYSCLVFCGLLGYSSFCFIDQAMSISFLNATQDCLMIFAWTYVCGLAYRRGLPATATFGIGAILYMQTSLPAGILRLLAPEIEYVVSQPFSAAFAFCAAFLLIGYTFLLVSGRSRVIADPNGGTADRADTTRETTDDLSWLADTYCLSDRETEVVRLLRRGYTLSQIGSKLAVSLNTVRSHTKSIYAKLGIHSKSELIELVEGDLQK